jgi:transposase
MEMLTAINLRREEIRRAVEALKAEDQQLATTEVVLRRLQGQKTDAPPAKIKGRSPTRQGTQREMVLEALAQSRQAWLRTRDIIDWAENQWGQEVSELSLRPLMTKLKNEGRIVRSGRFVALSERNSEPRSSARKDAR